MLQSLRSTPLHMRIRYLDQQASYEGPSKLSHTRKTGPEGASAVPNLVYLPPVNKSYFRHSETFTPSKLIIFHQGIRFSRTRGPEDPKITNLSPLTSQKLKLVPISFLLHFEGVQITFCFFPLLGMDPAKIYVDWEAFQPAAEPARLGVASPRGSLGAEGPSITPVSAKA